MSSSRAVSSELTTFTPPSARRPLATPTTRTRWPLIAALSPTRTPSLSISARSMITARLAQAGAQRGRQRLGKHHGVRPRVDARDEHRFAAGAARAAPIGIDPIERLDLDHGRVRAQQHGQVGVDRPAQVDALRAGIADPEISRGTG